MPAPVMTSVLGLRSWAMILPAAPGVGGAVSVTTRSMERTAERCAMAIAGSSKWVSIVWAV